MNGFLIRTVVTALGLLLAATLVPGIRMYGLITLVLAAVLFGVVNAVVRPALLRLAVPFNGVMLLVVLLLVNAAMLGLAALLLPGMQVHGVPAAVLGALVVSAVGWGASRFVGDDGHIAFADRPTGTLPPRL